MLFLAFSIFSSKRSQSATTRAGVFFASIVVTYVPRLPDPSRPTVIAEFAAVPRAVPAAAMEAVITLRRDKVLIITLFLRMPSTGFRAAAARDRRSASAAGPT